MTMQVTTGAVLMCTFGAAPSSLIVIPKGIPVTAGGPPAGTIMDFMPMANIPPFGMCMSPTNPMVISATAAALGVFTPMPCIPVTVAPWAPGAVGLTINNMPALNVTSKCMCNWGGVISITVPGQTMTQTP